MKLSLTAKIRQKLAQKVPPVSENDVFECFINRTHSFLIDTREDHQTDPVTQWFTPLSDQSRIASNIRCRQIYALTGSRSQRAKVEEAAAATSAPRTPQRKLA